MKRIDGGGDAGLIGGDNGKRIDAAAELADLFRHRSRIEILDMDYFGNGLDQGRRPRRFHQGLRQNLIKRTIFLQQQEAEIARWLGG